MTTLTITDIGTEEVTIPVTDTSKIIVQTLSDGPPLGNYIADHSLCINLATGDPHPQYVLDSTYTTHTSDNTKHYLMSEIAITTAQITDFDAEGIITAVEAAELTDGTETTLHYHDSDRARANHTGTQSLSTVITANTINTPTVDLTLESILSTTLSSGILDVISISHLGSGVLSLPGTNFFIRNNDTGFGTIYTGYVDADTTSITIPDNTTQYVCIDYNAGSPIWSITSNPDDVNLSDKLLAAICSRMGSAVQILEVGNDIANSNAKYRKKSYFAEGFFKATGGEPSSPTGLQIAVTAGDYWFGLTEYSLTSLAGSGQFSYYFYNSSAWSFGTSTVLNGTQYNNTASGLVSLTANYYCNHWIYASFGIGTGEYGVVYGQAEYSSLKACREEDAPTLLPAALDTLGVLVGVATVSEATGAIVEVRNITHPEHVEETPTVIPQGTPAASDAGIPGELKWDTTNLYVCVGDGVNNWKKVALTTI